MNNIEERIESLKACVALSDLIGPDELTVTVSDLNALIAQLEAAQKLNPLSVNVSELEATYIGDIRLHMAAISDWKSRAEKAEAELSAANEKLSRPILLSSSTVMSRACAVRAIKAAGFTVEGE